MPNTSATGGPLQPVVTSPPLEGLALQNFLQQWVVNLTGLDGTLVRPRWQTEPPSIPDTGTAWCSIGIALRPADTFPFVGHVAAANGGLGQDELQRHEHLHLLCSFYDQGVDGQADFLAALARDNSAIFQNSEYLEAGSFALASVGELLTVPSLLKGTWLYRVDLEFVVARQIMRDYPVENLLEAVGTIKTDSGVTETFDTST